MDGWLQDLRVGWRSLMRTPGYFAVLVVVLALGIGVNTMIFNIVNTFMFRPLPFIDNARNVLVWNTDPRDPSDKQQLSFLDLQDYRERVRSFESLGGYYQTQLYTAIGREPERFEATAITSGFMRVFDARPALGREFLPGENEKSRAFGLVILSHRIWKERFGGDRQVLGRTLKMNGRIRTIVGVAAPEFRFPETAAFFIPIPFDPVDDTRDAHAYETVGRLKPGVTVAAANAEIGAIASDLAHRYPDTNAKIGARVTLFRERMTGDMRPILTLLMSAVAFVLLIACANVANLMLARGAGRRREIALRFALGATRGRIVRQLLTESLIVALFGGLFGLLLAMWGRDLTLSSIPEEMPYWMNFSIDPNTVLFMVGVSLLTAVLAGLAPALQTSQVDVHEALKDGGHQGSGGRGRSRMRSALVVAEIALAVVLLAGAGLMIRSFLNMASQRNALNPAGVLTARLTMPIAVYKDETERRTFIDGLMPAIDGLPGVRSASLTTSLPLTRSTTNSEVRLDGEPGGTDAPRHTALLAAVRPGFFTTMGIALRSGRDVSSEDRPDAPRVALVSETAARTFWPGKDPLGQHFKYGTSDTAKTVTVIGVVADIRQRAEDRRPPVATYVPHAQMTWQTVTLVVRHDGDPAGMTAALRRVVQAHDPDMPLFDVRTMEESLRYGLWEQRIYVSLMGVFALLALVIAGVGIYGVMAYSVAQRTQEIGIRMALGAARADVLRLVVGQAFRLTILGLGIGLAGAYAVTRLMASLLFGVSASDPPTFIGVTVVLALSALTAAWLPADRATRVDPMVALRTE